MRNYVYALIDPTNNNYPFYIGKGMDNRLQTHFKDAERLSEKSSENIVGCDTLSILEAASTEPISEKLSRIAALRSQGFNHTHIARIIARRLDEKTAFAVEAFLIRSVYAMNSLTNLVEGAHAERFRSRSNREFLPGFDIDPTAPDSHLTALEARFGRYYVYTLTDPTTNRVIYVGKGTGRRMFAHFTDAMKPGASFDSDGHLRTLSKLIHNGHRQRDICRIEARLDCEQQAFAIEALLIKFVHGLAGVENRVSGHHGEMFRAKDDWQPRRGFDLPYVCDPGKPVDRADKREGMIGEGLAIPLLAIAAQFPELNFDPPKILNASELGIQADLIPPYGGKGVRLKIFIRRRKIQVELRSPHKAHHAWIRAHFSHLGATARIRNDGVFLPAAWKSSKNMTDDLELVAHRARILQEIVYATSINALSHESRTILLDSTE